MDDQYNRICHGDCIAEMNALPAGCVDLAFADPPFNIGYDYDVYDDDLERDQYIAWSHDWITAAYRVLTSSGSFWLAIGDEYAAELKLESQKIGFHCQSWVVWYYTFGVNCVRKFTRSHAHLFYFVKDPENFTFRENDMDNRIPSARQLVYNDKRANPFGRLPDDTWIIRPANIVGELTDTEGSWSPSELGPPADAQQTWTLRPQDLAECFQPNEDNWFFPRVAGTFKERAGFHGCQMPEQLLGRIIRVCSNEGDVVLDPFSGSATTLAVAKKLGRRYLGFDISEDYVQHGQQRLKEIRVGDRLNGSPEPLLSAPKTGAGRKKNRKGSTRRSKAESRRQRGSNIICQSEENETRYAAKQLELTLHGIVEAFRMTHNGFSVDRVVADPDLNSAFVDVCQRFGLVGDRRTWNILLFRLRKAGQLVSFPTTQHTAISWEDCDNYLFASEIALQSLLDVEKAESLDEILCDPLLATEFDATAARFAPGFTPFEYRWAALKLRKQAKLARSRGAVLVPPSRLGKRVPLEELDELCFPDKPGVYLLSEDPSRPLYVGETLNLRQRIARQFAKPQQAVWAELSDTLAIQSFLTETVPAQMLAWQSCLVKKHQPRLNFHELRTAT